MSIIRKSAAFCFILLCLPFMAAAMGQSDGQEIIEQKVKTGTADEIKKIIRSHDYLVDYSSKETGDSLLLTAIKEKRDDDIIRLLLDLGVDPMQKNKEGCNAVMCSAQYSASPVILETILKSGTVFSLQRKHRVLVKDKSGKTAFDYAADRQEMLDVLSKYASNPAVAAAAAAAEKPAAVEDSVLPDGSGSDAVVSSADTSVPAETETAASVSALSAVTAAAGTAAVVSENTAVVQPVYKPVYLFDVDGNSEDDEIPADMQNTEPAFPSNVNIADKNGRTPLMTAARHGDAVQTARLLTAGANVNTQDHDGWTALMYAARFSGDSDTVRILISNGADIKAHNRYGITPLMLAADYCDSAQIMALLLKGRSPAENEVRDAFVIAVTSERPVSIIQSFIDNGVPLNLTYSGKTPLMYAAASNSGTQIIALLLDNGAKTSVRSSDGKTAFDFAVGNKRIPHDGIYWKLNSTKD